MYTPSDKQRAFRAIAKQYRSLAAELGIPRSRYSIRPCYGGIVVPGEAIFHADVLYISAPLFREGGLVSGRTCFRQCDGRRDYTGRQNHWSQRQVPLASEIRRALPRLFPGAADVSLLA